MLRLVREALSRELASERRSEGKSREAEKNALDEYHPTAQRALAIHTWIQRPIQMDEELIKQH